MTSSRFRVQICTVSIAVAAQLNAAQLPAQFADSTLQRIVRERVESGRSAGIVLGVIDSSGARHVVSASRSGLTPPLDANSVFEIGSVTKVFTGTLLVEMGQRGELKEDDPAEDYLPIQVRLPEKNGRKIRLVDLSTHSSGLPNSRGRHLPADPTNPYADYAVPDMYAFLAGVELQREVGSAYEYSNLGAALLGHLLENRANVPYAALLRERILEPLEMNDTGIQLSPNMQQRLVPGHDASLNPARNWEFDAFAPAGALRSSMGDMLQFLAANLNPTASPLAATISESHKLRFNINQYAGVALNWHYLRVEGDTILWHPGETGGYHSFIGFNPARKLGVVVLSNSRTNIDDIGFHLLMKNSPLEDLPAHIASRREVTVDPEALQQFVGLYEFDPETQLHVVVENGKLFGLHKFGKVQLHAASASDFFLFESDTQIRFERNPRGEVTGLVEREGGKETRAVKRR
ncbi:MAG: serine hydrolase [Gemmatimonadota bacterium]